MPAAARGGDTRGCPAVSNGVAHVGGPMIGPGVPTVLIGGTPAEVDRLSLRASGLRPFLHLLRW